VSFVLQLGAALMRLPRKGADAAEGDPQGSPRVSGPSLWDAMVCQLQPDVFLLNSGIWLNYSYPEGVAAVEEAGRRMRPCSPRTRLVWRTTTPTDQQLGVFIPDRYLVERLLGWEVFDAAKIIDGFISEGSKAARLHQPDMAKSWSWLFYWDTHHFLPQVYSRVNQALVSRLLLLPSP